MCTLYIHLALYAFIGKGKKLRRGMTVYVGRDDATSFVDDGDWIVFLCGVPGRLFYL